jgi:uncharacterized protein YbjT (DUF2867 family)
MGSEIAARLQADGHQVVVMSRSADTSVPTGITVRKGDVRDIESLRQAMAGVDVVVNAVQFPNHPVQKPGKGHTYMQIDGAGTIAQVEAAKEMDVKRFVYISGAGVSEEKTAPWFRAKWAAENAVTQSSIPYTIFRPSWAYGPEDRTLNKMATFARILPFIPIIGDGQTQIQPVYVQDIANALALSLSADAAVNQTYEIGGPEALTMDEIVRTMLRVMGKRRPLVHHPEWFMKLVTIPLQLLPAPPLSPEAIDFVTMEAPVDIGPLLRDLPIRLTPLAEGLTYLRTPGDDRA